MNSIEKIARKRWAESGRGATNFEKQWAGDQNNKKNVTSSGLIIIKDNRSHHSYGGNLLVVTTNLLKIPERNKQAKPSERLEEAKTKRHMQAK